MQIYVSAVSIYVKPSVHHAVYLPVSLHINMNSAQNEAFIIWLLYDFFIASFRMIPFVLYSTLKATLLSYIPLQTTGQMTQLLHYSNIFVHTF